MPDGPETFTHEPFVFYDIILEVTPLGGGPPSSVEVKAPIEKALKDLVKTLAIVIPGGIGEFDTGVELPDPSGDLPADLGGGTVMFRQSATMLSTGKLTVENLGGGTFNVDSFFDVFLEVSYDGGANWNAAASPLTVDLVAVVPEPSALLLASFAGLICCTTRRH